MTDDVRDLLVALRGGEPTNCDWCAAAIPAGEAFPEEAGEWICPKCFDADLGTKPL